MKTNEIWPGSGSDSARPAHGHAIETNFLSLRFGSKYIKEKPMVCKRMMVFAAVAAIGLSGSSAEARGGFGHGGGHFGGFHGGGWRGAGFGLGLGFAGAYAGYGYGYPYGYGGYYPGYYDDGGDGGCHVERQRIRTRYGWRVRLIDVCD